MVLEKTKSQNTGFWGEGPKIGRYSGFTSLFTPTSSHFQLVPTLFLEDVGKRTNFRPSGY